MKKIFLIFLLSILLVNFSSAVIICIDHIPPSAPSNLAVSGEVGNILLTWDAATDEPSCSGIDYYNVSRNENWIGQVAEDVLNFTDTNISLTEGNWTYTVYAVDKVGHNRGNSIVNAVELKEENGKIIVHGGGGGSSYVAPDSFKIYFVSDWEFKKGFSKPMEKDDKMIFDFSNESHNVTILNVDYDRVEIVVSPTPQFAILGEGESKNFDLDNNNIDDLMVSVENISDSFAEIKIQSLNEALNDEIMISNTINLDEDKEKDSDKGFFSTITGGVIEVVSTAEGVAVGVFVLLALGGFVAVRIWKMK